MRQESHAPRCAGRSRSSANEPRRTDRHDAPRSGGSRLSKSLGLRDDCVERLIERFPGNHDRRAMPLDQFLHCFPALEIEIRDEALWPIDLDDEIAPGTHGLRFDPAYALSRHPSGTNRRSAIGEPLLIDFQDRSSIQRDQRRNDCHQTEKDCHRDREEAFQPGSGMPSEPDRCHEERESERRDEQTAEPAAAHDQRSVGSGSFPSHASTTSNRFSSRSVTPGRHSCKWRTVNRVPSTDSPGCQRRVLPGRISAPPRL
jgi:hypothetical protein